MGRPLSAVEHVNWLLDQAVCTNAVIGTCVSGMLTGPVLRKALDILQEKYPPLRWKIKGGDIPEFHTGGVPQIPLRIVERRNHRHYLDEVEKGMQENFPWATGPLVRVVQLVYPGKDRCDLVIPFCHVATDGKGCIMVIRELLSIAGKLSRGETVPQPPPGYLKEPLSSIELMRKDLKFEPYPGSHANINTRRSVVLKGDRDVPPDKRTTRVINRVISKEDAGKFVSRCKKEGTSVHGALCAAFLQAVVEQIRKSPGIPGKGPLTISCITPVDIRHHFVKDVEEDIGYYISFALHYQRIDDNTPIWPAAKEIKAAISTEIKYGKDVEAILSVGELWRNYSSPVEMARELVESYPPVVTTNLGRLDIPERFGDLILEDIHAYAAINSAAGSGMGFAVNTFRGHININFLYAAPYISRKRAAIIVERTMKRLRDAVA